jgi:VWFA-related protein
MLVGAVCIFTCAAADFRVDSNLVLIPVSVTDARNHAITGLGPAAFRIFDDKAEQKVVQFAREDAPLSVGIVFDLSGSMRDKIRESREAVDQFLRAANSEDEFFLVEFSNRASLTVPFTTDAQDIRDRLRQAEPHGKTALLDGLQVALDSMKQARHTRRALLIISDGGDNDSRYTQSELGKRLRESDLWIYAMGIYGRQTAFLPEQAGAGKQLLETLSEETGGRHYAIERVADLPAIAAQIGVELRNQYVLGFQPHAPRQDGRYHHVQIKLTEASHANLVFRRGYYGR